MQVAIKTCVINNLKKKKNTLIFEHFNLKLKEEESCVLAVHTRCEHGISVTAVTSCTQFNQRPLHIRGMTNLKGRSRKEIR